MPAPWWEILSTLVTGFASAALAWFGWAELRVLRRRRLDAEKAAAARIATAGFLVRRQLRSWVGGPKGSPDALENWLRKVQNAGTFGEHLDRAETQVFDMLASARSADLTVSAAVEEVAALFFNGTEWLNEYAATPRPNGSDIADWVNLRDRAWSDFTRSITLIESHLSHSGLLQASRRQAAKTRAQHPTTEEFLKRAVGKVEHAIDRLGPDTT